MRSRLNHEFFVYYLFFACFLIFAKFFSVPKMSESDFEDEIEIKVDENKPNEKLSLMS